MPDEGHQKQNRYPVTRERQVHANTEICGERVDKASTYNIQAYLKALFQKNHPPLSSQLYCAKYTTPPIPRLPLLWQNLPLPAHWLCVGVHRQYLPTRSRGDAAQKAGHYRYGGDILPLYVPVCGFESPFSKVPANKNVPEPFLTRVRAVWWSIRESNPWPPQCHCGALPTALMPHVLTTRVIIAQAGALVKGVNC